LGLGPTGFLLVVMISYIVLGMFMDPLSILLLTVPMLTPVINALDIPMIAFGVFAVFMSELAILTPPVGVLSYILHGITQDPKVNLGHKISLGDIFTAVGWFMPTAVIVAILMIIFPQLSTWLPSLM